MLNINDFLTEFLGLETVPDFFVLFFGLFFLVLFSVFILKFTMFIASLFR